MTVHRDMELTGVMETANGKMENVLQPTLAVPHGPKEVMSIVGIMAVDRRVGCVPVFAVIMAIAVERVITTALVEHKNFLSTTIILVS